MLQPFFEWMQALPLSTTIQGSWWMQAAINITHLLSLVFFIGGLLIVDLRLIGVGMREQPVSQVFAPGKGGFVVKFARLLTGERTGGRVTFQRRDVTLYRLPD